MADLLVHAVSSYGNVSYAVGEIVLHHGEMVL